VGVHTVGVPHKVFFPGYFTSHRSAFFPLHVENSFNAFFVFPNPDLGEYTQSAPKITPPERMFTFTKAFCWLRRLEGFSVEVCECQFRVANPRRSRIAHGQVLFPPGRPVSFPRVVRDDDKFDPPQACVSLRPPCGECALMRVPTPF